MTRAESTLLAVMCGPAFYRYDRAILGMWSQGFDTSFIAERLNIQAAHVSNRLAHLRDEKRGLAS
jgi:hypothetical protein